MPANRSTRRPKASAVAIAACGLDAAMLRGARERGSSRRAVGGGEKHPDSTHRCAPPAWARVDVEVREAQPEGFEGFGRGGNGLGGWSVQGGAGRTEFVALGAVAEEAI